jgi:hypothetical protein
VEIGDRTGALPADRPGATPTNGGVANLPPWSATRNFR